MNHAILQGIQGQTLSAGGGSLPVTSGLIFHLDASDNDRVYNDAGVTKATNNQTVQEWHSEDGADIFESLSSTQKPLYKTGGLNGLSRIYFDGSNDFLEDQTWSSDYAPSAVTIFIVTTNYYDSVSFPTFLGFGSGTNSGLSLYYQNSTNEGEAALGDWTTDYVEEFGSNYSDGSSNIMTFRGDFLGGATGLKLQINNDTQTTDQAAPSPDWGTTNRAVIGANISGSGETNHADFDLYEVIYYNRVLSDSERDQVKTYLNTKYSIY